MKTKFLLLVLGFIGALPLRAQTWDGTENIRKQLIERNPSVLQNEANLEAFTEWFIANHNNFDRDSIASDTTTLIIPVVFHILHDGGIVKSADGNVHLDDAHVAYEIQNMNEFWSATAPELGIDNPNIPYWRINPDFRAIIANMNIQFQLARKDPNGNATNGIDRIYTWAGHIGGNDDKRNDWPRDKYLNIWVANGLDGDTMPYGVLAYAMYPSDVTGGTDPSLDGIAAKGIVVGVNPADAHNAPDTYSSLMRSALSYEAGHWANLQATNGGATGSGICGNDGVDDTPTAQGEENYNQSCDSTIVGASCDTLPNGHSNSNVQNIMNDAYLDCRAMFTQGQKARARACLASEVAGRNNIWTTENLNSTGIEPLYDVLPAPIAQFGYNYRYAYIGQTIRFTDYTYNTSEWTRQWTFPDDANVTNVSGSDSLLNVAFTTPGWKTITLVSTNANGSSTKTKSPIYIYDNSQFSFPYPFFESFDDSFLAAQWTGISYDVEQDGNYSNFAWTDNTGHGEGGCFGLNGYNSTYRGDRDMLISPAFDFTGIPDSIFHISLDYSFACRYSYELLDTEYDSISSLEVYITKDSIPNWFKVITIKGNRQLFNAGWLNSPFTPVRENEYWKNVTIDLGSISTLSSYKTSGVHFMFVVNGAKVANNFFIDNINIGNASPPPVTDVRDITNIGALSLFPNPTAEAATLIIDPIEAGDFAVDVLDMLGNKVMTVFNGSITEEKQININTSALAQGVYSVSISCGGKIHSRKLVKL